jgi:ABC-type multidrug transport system ATPase subunit
MLTIAGAAWLQRAVRPVKRIPPEGNWKVSVPVPNSWNQREIWRALAIWRWVNRQPRSPGGEAQRVKIAAELSKLQRSKHTLYILDEPTTGLHLADVERLLECLNRLVDAGHTVLVIEHHLDVIKTADYVIDLGPEGGHAGGEVVAIGSPETIAAFRGSHTGRFLKERLKHPWPQSSTTHADYWPFA